MFTFQALEKTELLNLNSNFMKSDVYTPKQCSPTLSKDDSKTDIPQTAAFQSRNDTHGHTHCDLISKYNNVVSL